MQTRDGDLNEIGTIAKRGQFDEAACQMLRKVCKLAFAQKFDVCLFQVS